MREFKLDYPSGFDPSGSLADDFGLYAMPTTFVVDQAGIIRYRFTGYVTEANLGVTVPMLSDTDNAVWMKYGIPAWMMASNEPGHKFFLVGIDGKIAWLRDYGAPENGGAMYVAPAEVVAQVKEALGS